MFVVSATETVAAGREAVFAFLDDPANQVRVTPSLTGIADVRRTADGGKRLLYGYNVFGIVITGSMETITYDPPERVTFAVSGDIDGEIRWELEALGPERTAFTYTAEYAIDGYPGWQFVRPLVRWYNERELRRTVRNVARAVKDGTDRTDFDRPATTIEPAD